MLTATYRHGWGILAIFIEKFGGLESGIQSLKKARIPVKYDAELVELVDEAVDEWVDAEYPKHVTY